MRSTGTSYLLWLFGLIGFCGIHRFYNGKWITGLLWLFTGGLLFIGQIVDLFLIPRMVDRSYYKLEMRKAQIQREVSARHGFA